jgi:hypothetical protein
MIIKRMIYLATLPIAVWHLIPMALGNRPDWNSRRIPSAAQLYGIDFGLTSDIFSPPP